MAEFNTIPFTNTDNEDFICQWDSENYPIKSGEKRFFPSFLSEHCFKQFSQMMLKRELGNNPKSNKVKFVEDLRIKVLGREMATKGGNLEKTMKQKVSEHENMVKEMIIRDGVKDKIRELNV